MYNNFISYGTNIDLKHACRQLSLIVTCNSVGVAMMRLCTSILVCYVHTLLQLNHVVLSYLAEMEYHSIVYECTRLSDMILRV